MGLFSCRLEFCSSTRPFRWIESGLRVVRSSFSRACGDRRARLAVVVSHAGHRRRLLGTCSSVDAREQQQSIRSSIE